MPEVGSLLHEAVVSWRVSRIVLAHVGGEMRFGNIHSLSGAQMQAVSAQVKADSKFSTAEPLTRMSPWSATSTNIQGEDAKDSHEFPVVGHGATAAGRWTRVWTTEVSDGFPTHCTPRRHGSRAPLDRTFVRVRA